METASGGRVSRYLRNRAAYPHVKTQHRDRRGNGLAGRGPGEDTFTAYAGRKDGMRPMRLSDVNGAVAPEELHGLHLGRCARRILLLLGSPADEPLVLLPEREGRSAAESHRRAMRRLAEVGLIELSWRAEEVQI